MNYLNRILLLIIVFLAFNINATENNFESTFSSDSLESPDFTYTTQIQINYFKSINALTKKFELFFEQNEMHLFQLPNNFNQTESSLSKVDFIYTGNMGINTAFIKLGVLPNNPQMFNRVFRLGEYFIGHLKLQSGLGIAILLKVPSYSDALDLFLDLSKFINEEEAVVRNKSWYLNLMPIAYADTNLLHCNDSSGQPNNLNNLNNLNESLTPTHSAFEYIGGCALSAMKGVWNGSGGAIWESLKGVKELVTSPIETGKKFWNGATKTWEVATKFFGDFQNEAHKLYAAFDSLDPLVKSKIACEVIGTIGGAALLTYLTAGAASSTLMANLMSKINAAITAVLNTEKFAKIRLALELRKLEMMTSEASVEKNLLHITRGTPKDAKIANQEILDNLKKFKSESSSSTRRAGLTEKELRKMLRELEDHPVASLKNIAKYEQVSQSNGFCFGRAMAAHLKALLNGVDKNSVRKIWAIGDLKTKTAEWQFHVATMIRDAKGAWQVVDPIMGEIMPVEKWYKKMQAFDPHKNMRIIDTEASRFLPNSPAKYTPKALAQKQYEDYFNDLMKSFKEEVASMKPVKNKNSITPDYKKSLLKLAPGSIKNDTEDFKELAQ